MGGMSTEQIMQLTFLVLLGVAIVGSYVAANSKNLGKMGQQAAIWGLIFVGTIAAVGLWGDISRDVAPRQSVTQAGEITVPQAVDGHYYLTLDINEVPVDFVVDTGATMMVLTQADARRVGLDPDSLRYLGRAFTANGMVTTADVRLSEVQLGPFVDRGVPASVNGGAMEGSLLGMSYLDGFSSMSFSDGQLTLTR